MRLVRHITVVASAIAALMLACSSPDVAGVVAKNETPPTAVPSGGGGGGGGPFDAGGIPAHDAGDGRDGGDGGIASTDGGIDAGPPTKEAGVATSIQANVRFLLTSVTPSEPLLPNTSYDFTFEIGIHSSLDERFQLVPHIGAGWTAVVAGPDFIDATVASAIAGLTVTKVITVTTGAAGASDLVLDLVPTHFPAFTQSSLPTSLAIGATPTIPDGVVQTLSVVGIGPSDFNADTLHVPRKPVVAKVLLEALTLFALPGTYEVSAPIASPSSDWTVTRASLATITTNAPGQTSIVAVYVTPKSTGAAFDAVDGVLTFTITSADGTHSLPFKAHLQVVDLGP